MIGSTVVMSYGKINKSLGPVMNYLVVVFSVAFFAVTVGDYAFVRALRKQVPDAFAAVGSPKSWQMVLYSPALMGRYYRFILTRNFRRYIPSGTSLRLYGNVLYSLHLLLLGTAIVGALLAIAAAWLSVEARP
jgi:hypothetical protein